jgi:Tol biopolymer transport system component
MKSVFILLLVFLLTACTPASSTPDLLPTQDPTAVVIAAQATVTAMASGKPVPTLAPTETTNIQNSTPTARVVSQPKEFWITYLYLNKIYLSNGEGSKTSMLTNTPGFDYLPIWSEDGTNLAFIRFDGENRQDGILNIMPVGSNTPRPLESAGKFGWFAWLPGGQKIVASRGSTGTFDIYLVDVSSGSTQQIGKNAGESPRVSPDGKSILMLLTTGTPCDGKGCVSPNDYSIYDVTSQKISQITGDGQSKMTLGWSPDGQQIAYTFYNDPEGKAELMQPNGKLISSKQDLPWWTSTWKVSPDGSLIAYVHNDTNHGSFDLFVRPAAGGDPKKIPHDPDQTSGVNYIDSLHWRPDGTGLVYNLFNKIYTVDLDGANLRQISVNIDNVFFDVRPTTDPLTPPTVPTAPATWKLCPGALDSRLDTGRHAQVAMTPPNPNNVRESPGKQGKIIGQIQPGEKIEILSGPICENGMMWWSIHSLSSGLQGYTLEGDQKSYWLEPVK